MTDRWLVRENAVLPGSDSSGRLGTSIYNHGPSVPSKVNQEVMDSPSVRTYNGGYKGGKTVFNKNLFSILLLALLALPAFGAKQLGTITASGPIYLRGANVPGAAATSLPLLEGDRVVTGMTSTAVIQFLDSSRVDVFEESDLKVKVVDEETVICLEEGSIRFAAAPEARLVVCARDRRIEINAPSEGTITIDEESGQVVIEADEGAVTLLEERECSCDSKFPVLPFFLGAAGATAGTIAIIREEQPPRSGSAP